MSNFLSHLIGRSLGEGDRVRPRLPSLFEPSPETAMLGAVLPSEVSEPEMNRAPEPTETNPAVNLSSNVQITPQTQNPRPSAAPLIPPLKTTAPESVFPPEQPQRIQDLSESDLPFQPTITSTSPSSDQPARPTAEALTQHRLDHSPATPISAGSSSPPMQSVSGQETTTVREIVTLSEVRIVHSSEKADSTISPAQSTGISASSSVPMEPMPVLRPAIAATDPNTSLFPSIRAQPEQIASPATQSPTPTIHVSIGRIEVKATVTTPQSTKSRAVPAVMNLEDYLRQRGGER